MKEFNVIEIGKKSRLSARQQTLKSLVFLQLVNIAANQQPVFILSMIILESSNKILSMIILGSSNKYETKD